jgi:Tetratricopeptide repeat
MNRPLSLLVPVIAVISIMAGIPSGAFALAGRTSGNYSADAARRAAPALVLALLTEETLPPEEMATPAAAASPAPPFSAASPVPSPSASPAPRATGNWERLPEGESSPVPSVPGALPTAIVPASPAPAATATPGQAPAGETGTAPEGEPGGQAEAGPTSTAVAPPPLDVGSVTLTPPVSDSSLAPLIESASDPARATSLRLTERARERLSAGHANDAVRMLAQAVSIDPSNPYAYFFLGRAYLLKNNYPQALIFFRRAEIGFGSDPAWLGETLGFEGACYEEVGRLDDALSAYRQALTATPSNLMARIGYGRLSPNIEGAGMSAPPPPTEAPAPGPPENSAVTPPPDANAPPPAVLPWSRAEAQPASTPGSSAEPSGDQ